MKIKNKILFWFLVPSILIATISAVFCYYFTRKTVEQDIFNQLEIAADDLQSQIFFMLTEKRRSTFIFSSDGFIRRCTEEITMKEARIAYHISALNTHLTINKKSLSPNIFSVFVISLEGKIIASTDEKRIGEDVSGKECFLEATSHIGYNTEPYYDIHSKEMMIDFSTVLFSKLEREPVGIIVNQVKLLQKEDKGLKSASIPQDDEPGYYQLIAVNKVRILDFSSDGFIRDSTVEITRRDKMVSYYTDLLNEYLETNKKPIDPDILVEFIVDLDGNVISSTDIDQIGKNVSNETYFLKSLRRGSHISNLHYFPEFGINTFEVARLLKDTTNEYNPIGVIVNRYNGDIIGKIARSGRVDELSMVKQKKGMGETGEVYIVNSDKLMITGSRFLKDVVLKQVVDTEGVNTAFDNGNGMVDIYNNYRGVSILGVSRHIEEMDWVVLAEKDVSEAFAPIVHLRTFFIVMGVFGVITITGVSIFLARGLSGPVRKLTKATKRIADGDLENPIMIGKGSDEIRELSESFNRMMRDLAKSTMVNKQLFLQVKKEKYFSENLLEIARDAIVGINENGIVNVWNEAAENIFGYSKCEIKGQQLTTIIPERYRKQHKDGLLRFVRTGEPKIMDSTVEVSGITKKGAEVPIEMSLAFQKNEYGKYLIIAIIRDLTERKKRERRLNAQHAVTQVLSESTTIKIAFQKTLQVLCEALHWDFGEVWMYHLQDDVLRCAELWHMPTLEVSEFTEKTKEISFSPGIGLPGRVWASGKSAWINDVVEDSNFPRASAASRVGLHGAFGFPIIVNKEILGIIEFFSQKEQEPDNDLLKMMSDIGNQIGLFIKRNQADKELIESEEKYRDFIETAQDAFVGIDENGIISIWNKTAENIFRYTKSEILGKPISTILPGETIDRFLLASKLVTFNKIMEFSGRTKDGNVIPIEMSISSQKNDNERFTFTAIIRDITEKKKNEDEIQKLSRAVEQSPCTILITDYDGKIEYANPKFFQLTGYTVKECLGKNLGILKSGNISPAEYKELWETIKSGKEWHGEFLNKKKNGELFWESASISPIKNNEGVIVHFIAIKEDITERKKIEDMLQRSNQKLELLLSSIPSIIIELTKDFKVSRWNAAAENCFGIASSDIIGRQFRECGIQWNWDEVFEKISVCKETNSSTWIDDFKYKRPDESYGFFGVTINPIMNKMNEQTGILLLVKDITERKNIEQQLVHSQKMEAIGELAAGIAHEINTPTQFISNNAFFIQDAFSKIIILLNKYTQLHEMNKAGSLEPEFINELDVMIKDINVGYLVEEIPVAIEETQNGLKRVTEIVKSIKTFSHPDTKEKVSVDINKMIMSTVTVSKNEWKYVAEMETNFDDDLPPVPCYPGEFNQVVLNLIINAAHTIGEVSGNGNKNMGKISISTLHDGDWAEIRISDTGTGIPEEIRSRIFEPFFTTKEVGKGTGQGLSITHSVVVKKHNGQITFDTVTGKGTTFIIRLPISDYQVDGRE